ADATVVGRDSRESDVGDHRHMQDVASGDLADRGAEDEALAWVVRRTAMDVVTPFGTDHSVALSTWASGSGSRWGARGTSIAGDAGGQSEFGVGPNRRRQRRNEAGDLMRGRIVDAALSTLTSTGYANTSVRAIATTGGFSPALVFYHFGSVDALLLAVLDRVSGDR